MSATTSASATNNNSNTSKTSPPIMPPVISPQLQHHQKPPLSPPSAHMNPAVGIPLPLLKPSAAIFNVMQLQQQHQPPTSTSSPPMSRSSPMQASLPTVQLPLPPSNLEQMRLQQLYTLALADRMRFLHPALMSPYPGGNPHPSPGSPSSPLAPSPPRGLPPPDFHHPLYPYGKFDPRLFRLPEEPKPQQSYIGLISMAILSVPDEKLVLADIYQYILDNFAYFRHRGPGWRNSIRHNLSLNDCFIKSGRAANGKGHYWAIHPACSDDFKKGDYRRRKAQRKVRRHMGLAVDEEDSPSPPPPPMQQQMPHNPMLPHGWPPLAAAAAFSQQAAALAALHGGRSHGPMIPPMMPSMLPSMLPPLNLAITNPSITPPPPPPPVSICRTAAAKKRQFDVASLLGNSQASREDDATTAAHKRMRQQLAEISSHHGGRGLFLPPKEEEMVDEENEQNTTEEEESSSQKVDVVSVHGDKIAASDEEEEEEKEANSSGDEKTGATASAAPTASFPWPQPPSAVMSTEALNGDGPTPPLPSRPTDMLPHEYLARYYQFMHQNQQRIHQAAAAQSGDESENGRQSATSE